MSQLGRNPNLSQRNYSISCSCCDRGFPPLGYSPGGHYPFGGIGLFLIVLISREGKALGAQHTKLRPPMAWGRPAPCYSPRDGGDGTPSCRVGFNASPGDAKNA